MNWSVVYLPEAKQDFAALDGSQRILVSKAIKKVSQNPLPSDEGGYGKPLGNRQGINLTGFQKIKIRDAGIRIVYQLIRTETQMLIVVIGARKDEEAYDVAESRAVKYKLR